MMSQRKLKYWGKKFENVGSFKYLGSLVAGLNEMGIEIKSRRCRQ
jgi:hypothetical protein